MAFTVKLLRSTLDTLESDIKTYLDGQTISTLHSINIVRQGDIYRTVITFE